MTVSKRRAKPPVVEVTREQFAQLLGRIEPVVSPQDLQLVKQLFESHAQMQDLLRKSNTTMARLRKLFGVQPSEKTREVLSGQTPDAEAGNAPPGGTDAADTTPGGTPQTAPDKKKRKGHGRIAAARYTAALHIKVDHQTLHPGDTCPKCHKAKLYEVEPAPVVRISGTAPLSAIVYDVQRLRCQCGAFFTARVPEQAQGPKFDDAAAGTIAVLHYTGMPFSRLERIQKAMQTPVPASTQWEVLRDGSTALRPVHDELARLAAGGTVLHNDDTSARILSLMGKRRAKLVARGQLKDPDRKGLFTTAIVSKAPDVGHVVLFRTGRKHAGENLADLLQLRDPDLPPPVLMSDALERNVPKGHEVLESNCIAHGRRNVVNEVDNYPALCQHLLEQIGLVYKVDAECKQGQLSDAGRLAAHQQHSGPVMAALRQWMQSLLDDKDVEPNCDFGKALTYFLKRWQKFTVFLRVPGAPLDNNICERALKPFLASRKASLFYKTANGAAVGDLYLTLIYNALLHRQNPHDYLTALLRHSKEVAQRPGDWLPWNYRDTLGRLAPAA